MEKDKKYVVVISTTLADYLFDYNGKKLVYIKDKLSEQFKVLFTFNNHFDAADFALVNLHFAVEQLEELKMTSDDVKRIVVMDYETEKTVRIIYDKIETEQRIKEYENEQLSKRI